MMPGVRACMVGSSAPYGTVTLSGETIADTQTSPTNSKCAVRFNSDGTVDRAINGSYVQIDSGTDWIIPNGAAPADYQVRCASISTLSDPFTSQPAAVGTWVDLSTSPEWYNEETATGIVFTVGTFEIRKGTGSVLATGVYTLDAEVIT